MMLLRIMTARHQRRTNLMRRNIFRRLIVLPVGAGALAVLFWGLLASGRQTSSRQAPASTPAPAEAKVEAEDPDTRLSPAALQEDFGRLRFALEEAHAGLYRYVPKPETDKRFEDLKKRLNRPLRISEFYGEVLRLIGAIRDGHTRVRPPDRWAAWLRQKPVRPPISLHFEGERVRILRDGSGQEPSAVGWDVVAVNGRPLAEVMDALFQYIPGDGFSRGGRRLALEDSDIFGSLFALAFGWPDAYVFRLRLVDGKDEKETGTERYLEVPGLTLEEMERRIGKVRLEPSRPAASLKYEGEVAVLTLCSFGGQILSGSGVDYPDFLAQTFSALREKKTESLIIDVRDNRGGRDEYGLMLYAHLAPGPFRYYDRLQMNREKYEFLRWTGMRDADRPLASLRRDEEGRLVSTDHPNLGLKQPREPVYRGRVFILMNGRSFSATGEFMTAAYTNKRGIFIGEESGAGITGNTSGIMIGLSLPNSGITVFIPMVGYYLAGNHGRHPERGLLPDYKVYPTVEDILSGRDPVMAFALDLARRPQ
jgi:hypothetical protein